MIVIKQDKVVKNILHEAGIDYAAISKAESGFTNDVYFIDDKYVIKLSNDKVTKEKLKKEATIYQNLNLPFTPKYISSGDYGDYRYLIITRVNGKSLFSIWHTLSDRERTKLIGEIATMLKTFHQVDGIFLSKYDNISIKNYIRNKLSKVTAALQKLELDTNCLKSVVDEHLDELFDNVDVGLVYNDLHFDNIIYDGEKLYLIDFDRTLITALDYDMMIFKIMCDNPSKFANEKDEVNVEESDYQNVYQTFRNAYASLFSNEFVDDRIAIYQFIYLINQALDASDFEQAKHELQKFDLYFSKFKA